jgi:hypothetical protein
MPEMRLCEKPILNLREFHGTGAFLVIIGDVIEPRAHRIASHQPSIVGLHQFRDRRDVVHPRIEPEIIIIGSENDWHAVVDS